MVDPASIPNAVAKFEEQPGEQPLRCDVTPIRPLLNFSFRYQAGYVVRVPMNQYFGPGHGWAMLARITPEGGVPKPVYLLTNINLPNIPKTKVELEVGGGYLLGEGAYGVSWVIFDDAGRVCRKTWRVEVRRNRGERKVKVAMPPGSVWEISLRGNRSRRPDADDVAPLSLTILLHAAPMFPRRTKLRPNDMVTLMSTVSSLLDRVPTKNVRLVIFNLDQQKELYRQDGFTVNAMGRVMQAMTNLELGLVDFAVLQNQRGHVDMLSGLVNQELQSLSPSDVVLFLGPMARYSDKVPPSAVPKGSGPAPHFFYFQVRPFFRQGGPPAGPFGAPAPVLADSISSAVSRVGGKTIVIHNPADFAKAIERLERR
jgi:hypothetical protein